MIPLRDSVSTRLYPLIVHSIIAVNIIVFVLELTSPNLDKLIATYALIPRYIDFANLNSLFPFLTSQFLHGGWVHLISNMWFLHIFGDNVEEKFKHLFFLFVYIFSGFVGAFLQYIFYPTSSIPMIGASGAVAGVLGAYFVYFPHHRIETLVPLGFFMTTLELPASLMLIYWFVTQLFSGVGSIAFLDSGGVAFWAHVGGFGFGYLVAKTYNYQFKIRGIS